MSLFLRLTDVIERTARMLAVLTCAAVVLVMCAQVFFRYVLNDSLQWSEEIAVWLMVWMVFLAAPILTNLNQHVTVTALLQVLPPKVQAWLIILAKVLTLVFLVFLAWYGWVAFNQTFHRVSPSTGISSRWAKLAIPVGGALMTIMGLATVSRDLIALARGDREHFKKQVEPDEPVGDA